MAKVNDKASVLAFEKKLVPSDAYLYGGQWENRENSHRFTALKLNEKSVRGTISNRQKAAIQNDPIKLNKEVEKANLQKVDACALEPHQDTLKMQFTLKVLGNIHRPCACNNSLFKQSYEKATKAYVEKYGFKEIARRYALNLANARYLWRNRVGAEAIEVRIKAQHNDETLHFTFNALEFTTKHFDADNHEANTLANHIALALSSEQDFLLLDVECFAHIGRAQEVYPSEELILDKGKGKKSKVLYSVNDMAALHSQKVGNALRTIDTWYPAFSEPLETAGPIAIEPFGAVTNLGRAYRTPKDKQDFYTHFDKWARGAQLSEPDQHYVMAVLVRGGVFGASDK